MALDTRNLATVRKMWRREVEAAATYRHLADRERDQKRKEILTRLADQEDLAKEDKEGMLWCLKRIQSALEVHLLSLLMAQDQSQRTSFKLSCFTKSSISTCGH